MIIEKLNQDIVETFRQNQNMDEDKEFNDYEVFTAIANGSIEVEDELSLYAYLDDVINAALEKLPEPEQSQLWEEIQQHPDYDPLDLNEAVEQGQIDVSDVDRVQMLNFISEVFFATAEQEEDVVGEAMDDEDDEEGEGEDVDSDENEDTTPTQGEVKN